MLQQFRLPAVEPVDEYCRFLAESANGDGATLPPVNLLQGDYAPKASLAQRAALVHRLMTSVSVLLLVQVFYWVMVGAQYKQEAQLLREQSTAIYQRYFPSDKTIIDIRSQAEGHLSRLVRPQNNVSFVSGVEVVGEAVQGYFAGGDLVVSSIQYKRQAGDLVMEVDARNIAEVEVLRSVLTEERGLNVLTERVNQTRQSQDSKQGIRARLRINHLNSEVR